MYRPDQIKGDIWSFKVKGVFPCYMDIVGYMDMGLYGYKNYIHITLSDWGSHLYPYNFKWSAMDEGQRDRLTQH